MVFCWRSGVSLLFKTFTSVSFITVFSQRRRPRDFVLITPNKNLQKLLNGLLEFFRLSDNFCVMLVAWRAARRWSGICKQNNLYEISQASITQLQKFDDIQAGLHQAARSHKVHFSEWSRAFNGLREISQAPSSQLGPSCCWKKLIWHSPKCLLLFKAPTSIVKFREVPLTALECNVQCQDTMLHLEMQ